MRLLLRVFMLWLEVPNSLLDRRDDTGICGRADIGIGSGRLVSCILRSG
jgi:hypothetical protein